MALLTKLKVLKGVISHSTVCMPLYLETSDDVVLKPVSYCYMYTIPPACGQCISVYDTYIYAYMSIFEDQSLCCSETIGCGIGHYFSRWACAIKIY